MKRHDKMLKKAVEYSKKGSWNPSNISNRSRNQRKNGIIDTSKRKIKVKY